MRRQLGVISGHGASEVETGLVCSTIFSIFLTGQCKAPIVSQVPAGIYFATVVRSPSPSSRDKVGLDPLLLPDILSISSLFHSHMFGRLGRVGIQLFTSLLSPEYLVDRIALRQLAAACGPTALGDEDPLAARTLPSLLFFSVY